MAEPRTIVLVGARGCGKTTVGPLLAERLGWAFVDADVLLEAREGRSIAAIFAAEGEAGFRERESALLAELAKRERHVIATGGGVVLRSDNRARIRAVGLCVWLAADVATLWRRIAADPTTAARRPKLTKLSGADEIARLAAEREFWYREVAHVTVDAAQSPEAVVSAILSAC